MKRRNVQQAFIGEGEAGHEGIETLYEGEEALEIKVRGGSLMIVVSAGTPDEAVLDQYRLLGGELDLEDGSVLSFSIQADTVGAMVSRTYHAQQPHEGLSALPNVPGGA